MTTGGVARRLIDFANATVGHISGGLSDWGGIGVHAVRGVIRL